MSPRTTLGEPRQEERVEPQRFETLGLSDAFLPRGDKGWVDKLGA